MHPENYKYTKNHEWVLVDGNNAKIGLTSHAISELGDLTFLDITVEEGNSLNKDDVLGEVESVKTTSAIYAPVSGKIISVNEVLVENGESEETLNELAADPHKMGWMVQVEMTSLEELDALMNKEQYEEMIAS